MPLSGNLLPAGRAPEVALDSIDDELFSTDYRSLPQARHLSVLPEPPTVRLVPQQVAWPLSVPAGAHSWASAYYPASEYSGDENGTEIVLLIGIAVLLVVAAAGTGVVLWWFA